jgi:hypothetical protein
MFYRLCCEFGYINKNALSFDKLYALALADRSVDTSVDRKMFAIASALALKPNILDEMQYKEENAMASFDLASFLLGAAVGVGGAILVGRLFSNNSAPPSSRSDERRQGSEGSGSPAIGASSSSSSPVLGTRSSGSSPASDSSRKVPIPIVPSPPEKRYVLMAIETDSFNVPFPEAIPQGRILITEENKDKFFKLAWYLLSNQKKEVVQQVQQKIDSTIKSGFVIFSMELPEADTKRFNKDTPGSEKREAFHKLVGKTIPVLGIIQKENFPPDGFDFYTI